MKQEQVLQQVRKRCLSLPESSEVASWGHPNFRAGKRTFVTFESIKGRPSIAFRLNATDIDLLLRRKGFFVTPYGQGRWVSVWADGSLNWGLVERLIDRSYRMVALKRMIAGVPSPMASTGFDPVAGPDARVLILGTLPGAMALAKGEYYAQPRNAFWHIMAEVAGAGLGLPYEERKRRLIERRLALWDVVASAVRPGSLDSRIQAGSIRPNDFAAFLASQPDLQLICFNGMKAADLFARMVLPKLEARWSSVRRVILPSTSPAHAAMPLKRKIQVWRNALADGET